MSWVELASVVAIESSHSLTVLCSVTHYSLLLLLSILNFLLSTLALLDQVERNRFFLPQFTSLTYQIPYRPTQNLSALKSDPHESISHLTRPHCATPHPSPSLHRAPACSHCRLGSLLPFLHTNYLHLTGYRLRSWALWSMPPAMAQTRVTQETRDTIHGMQQAIAKYQYCKIPTLTSLNRSRILTLLHLASDSDEPYLQPSNRGNKLKRKAHHMLDAHTGRIAKTKALRRVSYRM